MKIAIYISNHGFGHATRMVALSEEFISVGIFCYLITDRPDFLFKHLNSQFFEKREVSIDFGLFQKNWIYPDLEKTEEKLIKLWQTKDSIIEKEVSFLREKSIDLVIGDIPPLAFAAAKLSRIKSIAISNFDWHFMYRTMLHKNDLINKILEDILEYYSYADLAIRLPFSDENSMNVFSEIESFGLLAKKSKKARSQLLQEFNIPKTHKIVLLSFGGETGNPININKLLEVKNITILTKYTHKNHPNIRYIPDNYNYSFLINNSDVIISKMGYSTLAEVVQSGNFLIYSDREKFSEDIILKKGLRNYSNSLYIPHQRLAKTNWEKIFETLNIKQNYESKFVNQNKKIAIECIKFFFKNKKNKKVIIDMGTNNVLTLWGERKGDKIISCHRVAETSALGKGMENRILTSEGLNKTKKILKKHVEFSIAFSDDIIITGSSCSREAKNISIISDYLRKEFNLDLWILSEFEEAKFAGFASIIEFPELPKILTFDIGGGSIDFCIIKNKKIVQTKSIPIGLRKLETEFNNDYSEIEKKISSALDFLSKLEMENYIVIGIGGAVCNLSATKCKLKRYIPQKVHKSKLSIEDIKKMEFLFRNSSQQDIERLMPFDKARAELILFGIIIIKEILHKTRKNFFLVNERGLQYGVFSSETCNL